MMNYDNLVMPDKARRAARILKQYCEQNGCLYCVFHDKEQAPAAKPIQQPAPAPAFDPVPPTLYDYPVPPPQVPPPAPDTLPFNFY